MVVLPWGSIVLNAFHLILLLLNRSLLVGASTSYAKTDFSLWPTNISISGFACPNGHTEGNADQLYHFSGITGGGQAWYTSEDEQQVFFYETECIEGQKTSGRWYYGRKLDFDSSKSSNFRSGMNGGCWSPLHWQQDDLPRGIYYEQRRHCGLDYGWIDKDCCPAESEQHWITRHPITVNWEDPDGYCPPGQLYNESVCIPCLPGTHAPHPGSKICTPCPRGTWNDQPGAITCTPCTRNAQCDQEGAASFICELGTHKHKDKCLDCPLGEVFITADAGSNELGTCKPCPDGTVWNEGKECDCEFKFISYEPNMWGEEGNECHPFGDSYAEESANEEGYCCKNDHHYCHEWFICNEACPVFGVRSAKGIDPFCAATAKPTITSTDVTLRGTWIYEFGEAPEGISDCKHFRDTDMSLGFDDPCFMTAARIQAGWSLFGLSFFAPGGFDEGSLYSEFCAEECSTVSPTDQPTTAIITEMPTSNPSAVPSTNNPTAMPLNSPTSKTSLTDDEESSSASIAISCVAAVIIFTGLFCMHHQNKKNKAKVRMFESRVMDQNQRRVRDLEQQLKEKEDLITTMNKKLVEAQKIVDDIMEGGGSVLGQYAIPYKDLNFSDETIGEGSFGEVVKGVLRETITVAIKTMRVSKVTRRIMAKFKGEICAACGSYLIESHVYTQVMAPLHHPNLVRLYGAVWSEGPDKLCIVLEYIEKGSLLDVLTLESDEETWTGLGFNLALGMAECLRYLHHDLLEPVIHRDIKPANILVDSKLDPKVADFGEARQFAKKDRQVKISEGVFHERDDLTMTHVGTPLYMAPEISSGDPYNKSVDTFSFSLVLLEIAIGDIRYVHKHCRSKLFYVTGGRPPIPPLLSEEHPKLTGLIKEAWAQDPHDRPEFTAIVPRLKELKPHLLSMQYQFRHHQIGNRGLSKAESRVASA